jgi:hypothetical protein
VYSEGQSQEVGVLEVDPALSTASAKRVDASVKVVVPFTNLQQFQEEKIFYCSIDQALYTAGRSL